jgi:hypothetical protein
MREKVLVAVALLMLSGCESSSDVLRVHFDAMTSIAKSSGVDCVAMGQSLGEYFERNQDAIRKAASDVGSSPTSDAKRVFMASSDLDEATRGCQTLEMESFRRSFSVLVMSATGVGP